MIDQDFVRGFLKLYILWKSGRGWTYGSEILEEMRALGFKVSPGTLYPTLRLLMEERDIRQEKRTVSGRVRKYYRATAKGREELKEIRPRLRRLVAQVLG